MWGVGDSAYQWCVELATPRITDTRSRLLSLSVIARSRFSNTNISANSKLKSEQLEKSCKGLMRNQFLQKPHAENPPHCHVLFNGTNTESMYCKLFGCNVKFIDLVKFLYLCPWAFFTTLNWWLFWFLGTRLHGRGRAAVKGQLFVSASVYTVKKNIFCLDDLVCWSSLQRQMPSWNIDFYIMAAPFHTNISFSN